MSRCVSLRLNRGFWLLSAWGLLGSTLAMADQAQVVSAKADCAAQRVCRFEVTLSHPDTGWQHYANAWHVEHVNGERLATRVLHHPHVDEQPFTRSLSSVSIPPSVSVVLIRAEDSKHGLSEQAYRLELP